MFPLRKKKTSCDPHTVVTMTPSPGDGRSQPRGPAVLLVVQLLETTTSQVDEAQHRANSPGILSNAALAVGISC